MTSSEAIKRRRGGGKPFVKGDPRINKTGRPKAFDFIRDLAQQIGAEIDPIIKKTNAEIVLRKLMREDGAKFLEIAYGKVPAPIELSGQIDSNVNVTFVMPRPGQVK